MQMAQNENFAKLFSKLENTSVKKVKHHLEKLFPNVQSDISIPLPGWFGKTTVGDNLKHSFLLSAKYPAVVMMLREMLEDNHHEGTEYVWSLA